MSPEASEGYIVGKGEDKYEMACGLSQLSGHLCSVVSDSLQPYGLQSARLFCPWNFPGKNTRMGCHFLLQRIFPAQGSNPGLPKCRQTLYRLSHEGSPREGSKGGE